MIETMNGQRVSRGLVGCAAIVAAAGVASPASAIDKSWNSDTGYWSEIGSWTPVGLPTVNDRVFIGNLASVENDWVELNLDVAVAQLQVTDGMSLFSRGYRIVVAGDTLISGRNVGEGGTVQYPSRILMENTPSLIDFDTRNLTMTEGSHVQLRGGTLRARGVVSIGSDCGIDGPGHIHMDGSGVTLRNDGAIIPRDQGPMNIEQVADGTIDLDGVTGNGRILLSHVGSVLGVYGNAGLSDAFSGIISMVPESQLHTQLGSGIGWTADAASSILVWGGFIGAGPSRITGSELTIAGLVQVNDLNAHLQIESTATFESTAEVVVGFEDRLTTRGITTINGALFDLWLDAEVHFETPTIVRAGHFRTISDRPADGFVAFDADTEWNGTVTIEGVARQNGAATVTGTTVINADIFDMDGLTQPDWNINAPLTINAAAIDTPGNALNGTINIGGGGLSRLIVNLADPDSVWTLSDELNMTGLGGLPVTRLAGSPVIVRGALNLPDGKVHVAAPITISGEATVNVGAAAAELRLDAESLIHPAATFLGAGTLQVGPAGDMTIMSGASTGGVGLRNRGTLRIGAGPGVAAVERFENIGTWAVQLGGYDAGTEYDRLIVSGGTATVGGTILIEHTDEDGDGVRFGPVVGDSFTILTAVGGVGGAPPATIASHADGWEYQWAVEVNPNDVTLRLQGITPPACAADFNQDGMVNSQDFFDFLAEFFASGARADVNGDGVVNSQDFFDFLVMFFKGCY